MTRSPLQLAALASAAVPGLDPVAVEGVRGSATGDHDVAFVDDAQERRWVVRAPRTAAAGALLHDGTRLAALLARRLEVAVPLVRGLAEVPEGMAAVYPWLPGRGLDFAGLTPGPLAADLGRVLAHVHNIERLLYEEAERSAYDAEAHRQRLLSDLDRAAATGHVPTELLTRWETRLEDVSLWRFAPTPLHGSLVGSHVLATFDDPLDAESGHVRGLLAWEQARIGDPADDFASLVLEAPDDALDSVLEAYTHARVERPDGGLLARAQLAGEMQPMRRLLSAVVRGDRMLVEAAARSLRELADEIRAAEEERSELAAAEALLADQAAEAAEAAAEAARAAGREAMTELVPVAEPDWDATQPHQPFPADGATQLIDAAPPPPPLEADVFELDEADEADPEAAEDPEAADDAGDDAAEAEATSAAAPATPSSQSR